MANAEPREERWTGYRRQRLAPPRRTVKSRSVCKMPTIVTPAVSDHHGLHLVEQQLVGHAPEVRERRLDDPSFPRLSSKETFGFQDSVA
jgi:hypothetical protein